jgi:hypothetical protein
LSQSIKDLELIDEAIKQGIERKRKYELCKTEGMRDVKLCMDYFQGVFLKSEWIEYIAKRYSPEKLAFNLGLAL